MELQVVDGGLPLQVKLTGEILPGDADRLTAQLNKLRPDDLIAQLKQKAPASNYDPRQWLWVEVESTGGDLEESLNLGRYLRSADALITTKQSCTSACVFLLAGAVERTDLAAAVGKIGIHRPYFADARGKSQASLDSYFTDLHSELNAYLAEMHVPTLLADMMLATPPEEIRMLTADELGIMFPARDPSWDEITVARRAGFQNVSSLAYRSSQFQAIQSCASGKGILAKNLSDTSGCMPAGGTVLIDEFATHSLLFSGRCQQMPGMFVHRAGNADFLTCVAPHAKSGMVVAQAVNGRFILAGTHSE
jgi:hypothetical protein